MWVLVIAQEADLTDKLAAKEKAFQKEKQLAQHLQQADAEMQKEVVHELPLCLPPSARPHAAAMYACGLRLMPCTWPRPAWSRL